MFRSGPELKVAKENFCSKACSLIIGIIFKTLGGGAITIILNIIALKYIDLFKINLDLRRTMYYILLIVPFGIAILNYLISALYKKAVWRCIPCLQRSSSPVFITQLLRHVIIFALTFAYSLLIKN